MKVFKNKSILTLEPNEVQSTAGNCETEFRLNREHEYETLNWSNNWLMTNQEIEYAMDNDYPGLPMEKDAEGLRQITEADHRGIS